MSSQKLYLLVLLCLVNGGLCFAQVDTEFWFAPPEVTEGHGDRPIFLRISTLTQSSVVTVSQPARNVQLALLTIPANSTQTVNLTSAIGNLETIIPATVMKTGLKISATTPVTAYYEVGGFWNADIFALKGKNALGNKFIIPGQNLYHNNGDLNPKPFFSFDIVATKDNTVVKVWPTKAIQGHAGQTVITIKLNAGETYSLRKTTVSASENPIGTVVESNKPIAITLKDDSIINSPCADLLGDQLIPVAVAGKEYVVLKGSLTTSEYVFITAAITTGTARIYVGDGTGVVVYPGQVYRHAITSKSTRISSDQPIFVVHVTGFGCETGMEVLPPINCRGSQQVGFTRSTADYFGLNILVKKEAIGHFKLNGSSALVPASAFSAVPGSSDVWYSAQISFTTAQIPVGGASLIENTENSFQLGIINGDALTTCRYGYFSSFSTLFIGDDFDMCEGETATLDAGAGKDSYLWSTGATTQKLQINSPGEYWVKTVKQECVLYDTIKVNVKKGSLDLGADVAICRGDTAVINGKENFSWKWSNGSTTQYMRTTTPGKYWVSVFDYTGCPASDTIRVSWKGPDIDLGSDITKCENIEVLLNAYVAGGSYVWDDGNTSASKTVKKAGKYSVKVTADGCHDKDTIMVQNFPSPSQDSITGSRSVCPYVKEVEYAVKDEEGSAYEWFTYGGSFDRLDGSKAIVNWTAANSNAWVKAVVTNQYGCKTDTLRFPVRINVELEPELPRGPDTVCFNKSQSVIYTTQNTNGSVYDWSISGGEIVDGQGTNSITAKLQLGWNTLQIRETSITIDTVCTGYSLPLSVYVFKDTTDMILHRITVDTVAQQSIHLSWSVNEQSRITDNNVFIYKRISGEANWQLLSVVQSETNTFTDQPNDTDVNSYEYYVDITNLCGEQLLTTVHTSLLLQVQADTATDMLSFRWNPYNGWPQGVQRYELWRKLDDDPGYRFLASVPNENSFTGRLAADGFNHQYVIRAVENSGPHESWSNAVELEFEHPVYVPNVFTPNGDPYNQFFYIPKIELYKNSTLMVFDRWGKKVFESKGYKNDWQGEGQSSGVYYYLLDLQKDNRVLKGILSIHR